MPVDAAEKKEFDDAFNWPEPTEADFMDPTSWAFGRKESNGKYTGLRKVFQDTGNKLLPPFNKYHESSIHVRLAGGEVLNKDLPIAPWPGHEAVANLNLYTAGAIPLTLFQRIQKALSNVRSR